MHLTRKSPPQYERACGKDDAPRIVRLPNGEPDACGNNVQRHTAGIDRKKRIDDSYMHFLSQAAIKAIKRGAKPSRSDER